MAQLWIVFEYANGTVAGSAQKSANTSSHVAVVHSEAHHALGVRIAFLAANGTTTLLGLDHACVVFERDAVLLFELRTTLNNPSLCGVALAVFGPLFVLTRFTQEQSTAGKEVAEWQWSTVATCF